MKEGTLMAIPNTHFGKDYIGELLCGKKKIFFAGIGGVSMCSLAHISMLRGHTVAGYDRTPSKLTRSLEDAGAAVYYESSADHVRDADLLVYTVAIPESNEEYSTAGEMGIPRISRADFLGYIMSTYGARIGVSGMHGKSTTTSMLERIFTGAGFDPTVSCGAVMKDAGSAHIVGGDDYFIFEACEYMDSFLDFYPTTAVILNIELDHVDYFESLDQIKRSFAKFAALTGEGGIVVANRCDADVMESVKDYKGRLVTFGIECDDADYNAKGIRYEGGRVIYDLYIRGDFTVTVDMGIPGEHYVWDATAAIAAAVENGVPADSAAAALGTFEGAARRMELCGKTPEGAAVYSDYAHHPTEVAAALTTAGHMAFEKVYCVFQPHTYSRTAEFIDDFAAALAAPHLRRVVVNDIYAAREVDTLGVSAALLTEKINALGGKATYIPDFGDIADWLRGHCKEGDMILIMGAGDINAVVKLIL